MVSHKETFRKKERLCSKKAIADLFENGNSFFCYPFQVIWGKSLSEIPFPAQVAFSVPRKLFRNAVTRNLLKRRIKEAYRRNKYLLYNLLQEKNIKISFIVIFKGSNLPDYRRIEISVREMINFLNKNLR